MMQRLLTLDLSSRHLVFRLGAGEGEPTMLVSKITRCARNAVLLSLLLAATFVPATAVARPAADASSLPACTIVGTLTRDTIVGTKADDVICAIGGNDHIRAGAGDDVLFGSDGNDVLEGGAGRDR